MKKTLLFSAILLMSAGYASSQLKVASDGKVGIAVGTSAPLSNLSVNTVGDSTAAVSVESTGSLKLLNNGTLYHHSIGSLEVEVGGQCYIEHGNVLML